MRRCLGALCSDCTAILSSVAVNVCCNENLSKLACCSGQLGPRASLHLLSDPAPVAGPMIDFAKRMRSDVLIIPGQAVEAVKEARQSSGSDADLGVDLDLVLARTFSKWKGHDSEALAIYERLAEVRRALAPAARLPVPSSPDSGFAMLTNLVAVKIPFFSPAMLCTLLGSMQRACWKAWPRNSE